MTRDDKESSEAAPDHFCAHRHRNHYTAHWCGDDPGSGVALAPEAEAVAAIHATFTRQSRYADLLANLAVLWGWYGVPNGIRFWRRGRQKLQEPLYVLWRERFYSGK